MATPRARRRRTIAKSRSTSWAESEAVGSSRIRTRASTERDLAISMSCWSAIDRPRTGAPTSSWTSSSLNSACADRRMAPQSIVPRRPAGAWPMNTFSATVRSGNRRGSWWTTAIPSERACAGPWRTVSTPSSQIDPASGWCTPARILTSVLFPAPFSPTRAWTSPDRSSSDTSSSAWVAMNRFETPRRPARGARGARGLRRGLGGAHGRGVIGRVPSSPGTAAWSDQADVDVARAQAREHRRRGRARRSGRCRCPRSGRTSRRLRAPTSCCRRSR